MSRVRDLNWVAVGSVVSALSLAAALFFNGVQVSDSASQQRQTKRWNELTLLTQLQNVMNESVASRTPFASEYDRLRRGLAGSLSTPAYKALIKEASNMDYFAWLFNRGFLTTRDADRLWGPTMICEWRDAVAPALPSAQQDYPDLLAFVRARQRELAPLTDCAAASP